jgi:diguanylate cyclase (GGDEF)-like protein
MQRSSEKARDAVFRKAATVLSVETEELAERWLAQVERRLAGREEPIPEEIELEIDALIRGVADVLRDPRAYRSFLGDGEHQEISRRLAEKHVHAGGTLTTTLEAYMHLRQAMILASREVFRTSDRPFFDLMSRMNRCVDRIVFAIADGFFKAFQAQIERQALTDPLTGLGNSRRFREALAGELKRSGRTGRAFSLIFADVDDFKDVNDRMGHVAADRALRAIGHTLGDELRSSDLVCRWGGDEFIILLPETERKEASLVAEKLRREVWTREECGGATISLGVACFPGDGVDYDSLVASADRALYQSKRGGKNKVTASARSAQNEFAF